MRGIAHHVYSISFRAQAIVGLVFVAWMISNVPDALVREQYVGVPLSVSVIAGVVSLSLLWPYLTPDWIKDPSRLNHLVPVVLAHAALPFLFGFVGGSAIVAANIAAPVDNTLGIIMGVFFLLLGAVCLFLGSALCFWAETPDEDAPRGNVSVLVPLNEARPLPRDRDVTEVDFQSARDARVSRVG
ncbi:MAG: hypothetical protein AAFQ64_13915 [Pseudomonadota bacterium]